MNGATLGAGRKNFAWVASASSAAANIGLLLLFVPTHGIYAAAVASAIGYFVLLVTMATWAHASYNPVKYDWLAILRVVALGVAAYGAAIATRPSGIVATICVQAVWLLAFGMSAGLLTARAKVTARLRSAFGS